MRTYKPNAPESAVRVDANVGDASEPTSRHLFHLASLFGRVVFVLAIGMRLMSFQQTLKEW